MIPLEDFFRKPERVSPRLSPDGTHLAFLAPWNRRLNLFVQSIDDEEPTRITQAADRDLAGFLWANDQVLLYIQDQGGDENFHLFSVGLDGKESTDLTPFPNVKCMLLDDLEDDPEHVLFQMNQRVPEIFDVYRLHLASNTFELIGENPGNIQQWIPDHKGKLRSAVTTDGVNSSLLHREDEKDEFKIVATYGFRESCSPLQFDFNDQYWIASSNVGRDKRAIVKVEPHSAEELEILFEHPEVDVHHVISSTKRKCITGYVYETDKTHIHFVDAQREQLQRRLEERHPGSEVTVVSMDREERRCIAHVGSDRDRGTYFLVDIDPFEERKLFAQAPWLNPEQLCEMRPIQYLSRDGRTIHGYLTTPNSPGPHPLIVHPHGGPWHRDSWGFNPELQFLANRGYAVLQMNFRGSTGYGRDFWEASFGEWGLAMQDDVTDGTRWAIEQGHADAKRIAIYGGSYGGYSTLAGLVREPELYACGVSYVGVSNLFTWLEAFPPYWKPFLEMVYEMVGHPEHDEQRLRETSPVFNVERIQVPLLVVQGANDPRVRKEESDQIVEALQARNIPVDYLLKDNEGHGFQNEENIFEFYRRLESFLNEHLN